MGYLYIHRKPLHRSLGTRARPLQLLLRPPVRLSGGGPTGCVLLAAQVSSISRGSGPVDGWRYGNHRPLMGVPDNVSIAILLTRAYALWERNKVILWGLLAYSFGFAGFAAVRCS